MILLFSILVGISSTRYVAKGPMGRSLAGYISKRFSTSKIRCGVSCIQESAMCRSFNFNTHTGACELNSKRIDNVAELSAKPGFQYYDRAWIRHTQNQMTDKTSTKEQNMFMDIFDRFCQIITSTWRVSSSNSNNGTGRCLLYDMSIGGVGQ